tara:strand:- start:225 stop:752 length:528 start_codon:yes stop_codon:yes gene_type:complete
MLKHVFLIILAAVVSCTLNKETALANIVNISNDEISGKAMFEKTSKGIRLTLTLAGKKNSTVAAHIHSGNECDRTDGSKALGHWNPTGEDHGYWGTEKFHSGDLGNIKLNSSGKGELVIVENRNRWSIEKTGKTSLIGKTIIIHSGYDDGKTQPAGNAGRRVGCGVIAKGITGKQ